jgi:hypothetical protein
MGARRLFHLSTMKTFLTCLCLVVASATISAQGIRSADPSAMQTLAAVSGVVTKDPGSEPLKKALIELIAESQNEGGNYTAVSGPDGSFRVENISPGRYRMFVERTGYREIDKHHRPTEGRVITFTAGQEIQDLVIRLQSAVVVEGRVTDEDGDPMPDSQVTVFHQTYISGRSHWEQAGAERTNDLGEYRIADLAAGSYFVSVTPPPDFRSLIETSANTARNHPLPDKPALTSYQTTYYPGARDRAQAAAIQLHAGEDFPINFSLTPSPSLTIRGSVANLAPGAAATITLESKDFNLVLNGAEMHKDGSFEIRDVSPGAYTILANVDNSTVPLVARQSLQVGDNVEGLRLAPQPGGTIRGRLRLENSAVTHPDLSQIFLLLRSADGDDSALLTIGASASPIAKANADGSLQWDSVPPGHYFVQISDASSLPDYFLKSVASGGRDLTDAAFQVNGAATSVDVLISARGATLEGIARNAKDEPVADAVVVAVPEPRFRVRLDHFRKATTDQSGHFTLRGLPPGSYTVFAWENVEGEAYYNPEFLRSYEGRGKALRVGEGDRASMQVQAIPEVGEQP